MHLLAEMEKTLSWADYGLIGLVVAALIGTLIWFVRHAVTVTLPTLVERHAVVIETMTGKFDLGLREARADYKQLVKEEREECQRRHEENATLHTQMISDLKETNKQVLEMHRTLREKGLS